MSEISWRYKMRDNPTIIPSNELTVVINLRDSGKTWGEIERVVGYCKNTLRRAYRWANGIEIKPRFHVEGRRCA